jgi:MFS family permease
VPSAHPRLDGLGLRGTLSPVSKNPEPLPPDYRWNFFTFLTDFVSFGVGFTFFSPDSVLPAFALRLTENDLAIGMAIAVFQGGWLLPQVITAHLISDKPRKKPYMLIGMGGRALFLVIALALWGGLADYPTPMLILFLACIGLFSATDGFVSVAWFDVMARAIPPRRRGRLIAAGQAIKGLIGIGAGVLIKLILNHCLFPLSYVLIFTLASVALIPSAIALSLIREPPPVDADPQTDGQVKGSWLRPLLADQVFRRWMLCRLLVGLIGLATPFYVKHAEKELLLPESITGDFVLAQTLAGVVMSILLGPVSERWGPRHAIRIGSAAAAVGPLFALAVHLVRQGWLVRAYPFVFIALGIIASAWMLGFYNYLLEIAPAGKRAAYVGTGNTTTGLLTLAPIAGGWLLKETSYTTLFGLTAALVTVGFLLTLGLKPAEGRM